MSLDRRDTRIALIDAHDLLGKELRETLDRNRALWNEAHLLTTDPDQVGSLTEIAGEAVLVQSVDEQVLHGADIAFFFGPIDAQRRHLASVRDDATAILFSPDATAEDGQPIVGAVNLAQARAGGTLLSPPAAVVGLAHLTSALQALAPRSVRATVLQPASVRGGDALDEVLKQTRGLLTFKSDPPRAIFGAQQAFNLLPGTGDTTAALLAAVIGTSPRAQVQTIQASVFHGIGISLHVAFDHDPGVAAIEKALDDHVGTVRSDAPDVLGPIDAAAHDGVAVGPISPDGQGGYWLWAVLDNLTVGGASNALAIVEALDVAVTH